VADRVGQQLGNYQLVSLLGEGGFAEIYLGEHIHLGTQAAIKVLHTRLTSKDMEQFRAEARTIARLEHPHIVRILEFGIEDKTPFLVMSYAPNGTLRQRHPKGVVVPLPTIVSYVKQVADALQYAHDEKLIHRDVKPENMLLGRRGEVLLSDFGIALISQSSLYQSTKDIAGTIAYMAPEQIQAHPRPASDQYALGVVVYEWLNGDHPFHGSFWEIAVKHGVVPPPPLHEKVSTISPIVEQVVLTALAKDPKQRFGCIRDFAIALEEASQTQQPMFLSPEPSTSTPALLQTSTPSPVTVPPFWPSSPPSYEDSAVEVNLVAKALDGGRVTIESRDKNRHSWGIERQQVVAMLIGTTLFGTLLYCVNVAHLNQPLLDASLLPSFAIADLLYALIRLIPLFFAATYGPWVGLCTAGVGGFFAVYFTDRGVGVAWPLFLGGALGAFIAGLALVKTRGRYYNSSSIVLAVVLALLGEFIVLSLPNYAAIWLNHTSLIEAISSFLLEMLPSIILILLLFPLLLVAYSTVVGRKRHT
jgi:serine/threonine protein kinase